MRAAEATDSTYAERPAWSVGHRFPASGAQSPDPSKARVSVSTKSILLASAIVGVAFGALTAFVYGEAPSSHTPSAHHKATTRMNAPFVLHEPAPASHSPEAVAPDFARPVQQTSVDISSESNASGQHTQVTINGEDIPVPANGNIHKVYTEGNSHSTIDISVSSTSSSSVSN